jgi:hypothetical protein
MFSTWKMNCSTLNSVVSNSECIASNDQVVLDNEWKAGEGSGNGLMEDYPSNCVEGLRETTEKPLSG